MSEVKEQGRARIVAASIAGTTLILGFAGYGVWATFQPQIKQYIKNAAGTSGGNNILPAGAVAAFDLSDGCPEGWTDFKDARGRVIIGSGKGEGLTRRAFREPAGIEQIKLEAGHLPKHSHPINAMVINNSAGPVIGFKEGGWFVNRILALPRKDAPGTGVPNDSVSRNQTTLSEIVSVANQQKSLNNMSPYISLFFCKKDK